MKGKGNKMEQVLIDNNSLNNGNLPLKLKDEEIISGEKKYTGKDILTKSTILELNAFASGLSNLPYQEVYQYIVNSLKNIFNVNVACFANFDERSSSLFIKDTSLSSDLNSRLIKLLGQNIINLGIHISDEQYAGMVNEKFNKTFSLHELSFDTIPEQIGKNAQKLLDVNWFVCASMLDRTKLVGTLIIAGNTNQIPPEKKELLTYACLSVNAIARAKAEEELHLVRIQNRALLQAMPDLILVQNDKGVFMDCHAPEAFTQFASPEQFIGKSMNEIFPKEHIKVLKPVFRKAVKTKEVQILEFSMLLPGGLHNYESRIIAFNEDNILSIIRDISDRKVAEKALRESEEKYRTMVQYSSDPIFSFNPDESYRFVNENFARAFGKLPDEIIGKTPHQIFSFEEAEKRLTLVRKVFKSGEKGEIEVKVVSPDGSVNYYITIADPIKDEKGRIIWVSCISKNITERILTEMRIKQQNQELIELNKTKDKFFSIIAHDLKNPFNSLLGLSELLLENFEIYGKDKIKEFVGLIASTSNQTYRLLENLLAWSGIQQGMLKPVFQRNNLKTIALEIELLKEGMAKNKSIKFQNCINDDIFVNCDAEMTKTILRNLISNAIKFTHKKGLVSLSVSYSNSEAIIAVKDNGIGIKLEKIEKLFKIEKSISTQGTSGETGTGLGLLLCKELVEMQGGKLWLKSEVEKGSMFFFSLKLCDEIN